jgi:HTH-type transcriptional regulator/antitoxin HigA
MIEISLGDVVVAVLGDAGTKMEQKPGDVIKELMDEHEWSQSDLAYMLGVTPGTINQLISSKRPITAEMAKLLSAAFGQSAEKFVELQGRWSLAHAPEPDRAVRERIEAQSRFPLREMARRGWIDELIGDDSPNASLCRFFKVNSIRDIPSLPHAARKSTSQRAEGLQLAWLYRVQAIAREMRTPLYSSDALMQAVERMSQMREAPEQIRHVARLLREAGVRFVVVEGLPGGRIDGVCLWLDSSTPVIGMSLRLDRIDNFWFVLRHECAHVLHGHGKAAAIIDNDVASDIQDINEEERIANMEAADFCVAHEKMQSFYLRKNPYFSDADVRAFAKINRIHPGLVVGQIHNLSKQYKILRQHLVNVRNFVTSTSIVDGWGNIAPVD